MKRKLILIFLFLASLALTGCLPKTEVRTETESTHETEFEPSYYPLLMQVTEIETETDIITAIDPYGSCWKFISDDAFIGDLYSCIMCDNGTEEVEDHEIVKMRFSGNISDYASENMIDMNSVVSYEETETGILFNFDDGSGYYLELTSETN